MIGGPIWHDKIHNIDFVKQIHDKCETDVGKKFGTVDRIKGVLGGIIDEDELSHKPLSFDLSQICSNLKVINPTSREIISGFTSLNYKLAQTYYDPTLWKTDAPPEAIYDIIKAYKKQLCEKEKTDFFLNIHKESPMMTILQKPLEIEPDFNMEKLEQNKKLRKYFVAPEANWGPKARATGGKDKK